MDKMTQSNKKKNQTRAHKYTHKANLIHFWILNNQNHIRRIFIETEFRHYLFQNVCTEEGMRKEE